MGSDPGADRVRGGDEHLQFHGWDQWDHGGVFDGGALAVVREEWGVQVPGPDWGEWDRNFRGPAADYGDDPGGTGVCVFQLPAEEQGPLLCRRRGIGGDGVHPAVFDRVPDYENERHHLACLLDCVWRRWLLHDRAPDHAARAPGGST